MLSAREGCLVTGPGDVQDYESNMGWTKVYLYTDDEMSWYDTVYLCFNCANVASRDAPRDCRYMPADNALDIDMYKKELKECYLTTVRSMTSRTRDWTW